MSRKPSKRTICLDGAKMLRLRLAKGWSQEQLLERTDQLSRADRTLAAIGSKRTISRAENGEPIYIATGHALAKALGTSLAALAGHNIGPEEQSSNAAPGVATGNSADALAAWQRREYALKICAEWNDKTMEHRKVIEARLPGLVKSQKRARGQLTRSRAAEIYNSKQGQEKCAGDFELFFHIMALLNHFETIATAYRHEVADRTMIEESFRDALVWWHDNLQNFIAVCKENVTDTGFEPWKPFVDLVRQWKAGASADAHAAR